MLRLASALSAALLAAACGRSHDLGVDTTTGGGGGSATTTTSMGTGGAQTTTTGTGGGVVEPPGPTALTVVNGINDYGAVILCFLPGDTPWPPAGGLPFGVGQAVDIAGALPPNTDVTPWVIAGDLADVAGKTCTEILALAQTADGGAGPPLVAAQLGVIPKAVLATSDRSLLLVPMGCMGGAGHDAANATTGCGMGYTSKTPTTGVVFLGMSRITDPKRVSLQVVSASPTFPVQDYRLQPSKAGAAEAVLASQLSQGAIGPSPPFDGLALADFGPLPTVQLRTYYPGSSTPTSTTMLSDVLAGSTVGTAGFTDGAGLVLVALGGTPGAAGGPFWHALTYALIKANPG